MNAQQERMRRALKLDKKIKSGQLFFVLPVEVGEVDSVDVGTDRRGDRLHRDAGRRRVGGRVVLHVDPHEVAQLGGSADDGSYMLLAELLVDLEPQHGGLD